MTLDPGLAETQRAIWERIAPFWANHKAEHGQSRNVWTPSPPPSLVTPGDRILELGCGEGSRSVALAEEGAEVTATDLVPAFVAMAAERGASYGERFRAQLVDASDPDSLASLDGPFRGVVAEMVLMNLFDLAPLASSITHLLEPGGWFAVTVLHPCFGSPFFVDTDVRGKPTGVIGRLIAWGQRIAVVLPKRPVVFAARLLRPLLARSRPYLPVVARRVVVEPGQPEPHFNIHRPLALLLEPFFAAGLVLEDLREASAPGEPEPSFLYLRFRRPDSLTAH